MTNEEVICDVLEGDSWLWGFDVKLYAYSMKFSWASLIYYSIIYDNVK